jgi:hypothetical protein
MPNVPPTAENAHIYADFIAQQALKVSKVKLDYSPKSLEKVDDIIEGFRREGQTSSQISATLFSFGCYVGEVFVRHAGAKWKDVDQTPMKEFAGGAPIVVELPSGTVCNPIGKIVKRLENGQVDSLAYFYKAFTTKKA